MGMCNSCPFNYCSDESEYAQNMGCLPAPVDVLKIKDETGHNWACHSNNKRICAGLSEHRDTSTGGLYLQPCSNHDWISWDEKDLQPIILMNV